ncbi:MAG: peptidoglycan editing factor PgeF [Pseudomonadota bacterium]|nr:peptidoglycan editing factor PgeF [Pseudomonadota bacterium]
MFITPNWPKPKNVRALCTTRLDGVSSAPFHSLNLATHVEDNPKDVMQNRALLRSQAQLPAEPIWLNQQHTDVAVALTSQTHFNKPPIADAAWTKSTNVIPVVMTADCLPILITDNKGSCVAAIHAGWKGLADKIVTKTIQALPVESADLMAWIGPAISVRQFEVGQDVFDEFVNHNAQNSAFFHEKRGSNQKYLADLPGLVSLEMQNIGVKQIYDSQLCSFENEEQFFSYRRDGKTGRMASLIWIES